MATMKDRVEAQVRSGRYSTASDDVHDLIRRDQERAGKLVELQRPIAEGIESGVSERSPEEVSEASRAAAAAAKGNHAI